MPYFHGVATREGGERHTVARIETYLTRLAAHGISVAILAGGVVWAD
jgi:hypothetical protein